jgi:hypothetical protein
LRRGKGRLRIAVRETVQLASELISRYGGEHLSVPRLIRNCLLAAVNLGDPSVVVDGTPANSWVARRQKAPVLIFNRTFRAR